MNAWRRVLIAPILAALGTTACGSDESPTGPGPGRRGDADGFSFPYDYDASAGGNASGTTIGEVLVDAPGAGSWERAPRTYATSYYVRPPGKSYGSGDGSTWANAFSGLPAHLVRDAKYYVASGEYYDGPWGDRYFQHEFDDADDGERYIGIIKATSQEHGSEAGWEATFGQGTARFGPIALLTGHYEFDGREGIGGEGEGYGLSFSSRDCKNRRDAVITFPWNSTSTNVSIRHVNIGDCGHRPDPTNPSEDAIYSYANGVTRFALTQSYVHDAFRCLVFLQNSTDVLIEGTTFARAGLHHESNALALREVADVAIRRNVIVDSNNTYISLQGASNVQIHGNVLRRTLDDWNVWAGIMLSDHAANVTVNNNTFYRLTGLNVGVRAASDELAASLRVTNNLWVGSRASQIMLHGSHEYNAFYDNYRDAQLLDDAIAEPTKQVMTTDPFVAGASGDVRLVAPTQPGVTLASPYDVDLSGVKRGNDGVWDRGAYEFQQ